MCTINFTNEDLELENELIDILNKYNILYIKINNTQTLKEVRDLFINRKVNKCNEDDMYILYLSTYYRHISKNNKKVKKCLLLLVNRGNMYAMHNLARLYEDEYDLLMSEKYYLMAFDLGLKYSILCLAKMYCSKTSNLVLAIKYFKMAIKENIVNAYYYLAIIYKKLDKIKKSKKYLLLGANSNEKNCIRFINYILDEYFDVKFAIKSIDFLEDHHLNKLNSMICEILKYKTNGNHIINDFPCVKCKKDGLVIFKSCGHAICIYCFKKKEACVLCGKNDYNGYRISL
jgi:tetratricopeptide (TPR) repeat protein